MTSEVISVVANRQVSKAQEAKVKLRDKNRTAYKVATATSNDSVETKSNELQDDGLQSNERNIDTDMAIEKANKNTKDVLLNEAVNILSDEVLLLNANPQLTNSVLPKLDVR